MLEVPAMTKLAPQTTRPTGRWLIAAIFVVGLISMIVLGAMIAFAIGEVRAGRGLETHRTFWLVEDSWIGFLTFVACALAAIVIGLGCRLIHQQRERRAWLEHDRKWAKRSDA
jgi:uncharacterized membrane protein